MRVASRPTVERLLDGGVEIATFDPTMLHAKVLTIDGDVSSIGSANFNNRSTQMDEETNVVTDDPRLTAQLDAHFDDDWERSTPADVNDMADPGIVARSLQPVTDLFQRYM